MLVIRTATADDAEWLSRLCVETYRDHFSTLWSERALAEYIERQYRPGHLADEIAAGNARYEVIYEDADAIGFAKIRRDQTIAGIVDQVGLEVEKIYLLGAHANRGAGRVLFEHLLGLARVQGQQQLWLKVLKDNLAGVRFYERHGLAKIAEIPFASDLREVGMWVMARRLA